MVSKPQVDIAHNQDVLDSLNHGFEEASGIFFVATGGCDEAEPGEHGNDHGHLDDHGVDIGVYAEHFEAFGFAAILRGRCSWIFFSSPQSWAVFQIPPSRAAARS